MQILQSPWCKLLAQHQVCCNTHTQWLHGCGTIQLDIVHLNGSVYTPGDSCQPVVSHLTRLLPYTADLHSLSFTMRPGQCQNDLRWCVFLRWRQSLPSARREPSRHMYAGVIAPGLTPRPPLARTVAIWSGPCARGRMSSALLTRRSFFHPMDLSTAAATRKTRASARWVDTGSCREATAHTGGNGVHLGRWRGAPASSGGAGSKR